jgi:3-hydroxyacyl-CoA dehydrogenase
MGRSSKTHIGFREVKIMTTKIKKVAIIGAGVMGSQEAANLASCGIPVLLLEIAPKEGKRDTLINAAFAKLASQGAPSPYLSKSDLKLIELGSFDPELVKYTDDFSKIAECDFIWEAVVELPQVKYQVYQNIMKYKRPDAIVGSVTSGLPASLLCKGMPEEFEQNFVIAHPFNPPIALPFFEVVAAPKTKPEVVQIVKDFLTKRVHKKVVVANDVPCFVGNRVGMASIMLTLREVLKGTITFAEAEVLTGPLVGRPKSATFRTADIVGLGTLYKVASQLYKNLPNDPQREIFAVPAFLEKLASEDDALEKEAKAAGKTYKRRTFSIKDKATGQFFYIDPATLEYKPSAVDLGDLKEIKKLPTPAARIAALLEHPGRAGQFTRTFFTEFLGYCSQRIPEITAESSSIDVALKYGFGWEAGPFELWDEIGTLKLAGLMKQANVTLPQWVRERLYGQTSLQSTAVVKVKAPDVFIKPEAALFDLGNGVAQFELRSKMNTASFGALSGLRDALDEIEYSDKWHGMVLGSQTAENFCSGANLEEIGKLLMAGKVDELRKLIRDFQVLLTRMYSFPKPIVGLVKGLGLGGGGELALSMPLVVAHHLAFIGLVELGVGVIPAGTGTTHFAYLASRAALSDKLIDLLPHVRAGFMRLAMGEVSRSAVEASEWGFFGSQFRLVRESELLLSAAKSEVLRFADGSYNPRAPRGSFAVVGAEGRAQLEAGVINMLREGKISEYDAYLANTLAFVMCGGELTSPTIVTEQYMYDLELEAFMGLLMQPKTQERIRHFLTTGSRLKN